MNDLQVVAMSWYGTPFFRGAERKREGVDCIHLVRAILEESGRIPPGVEFPNDYHLDEGSHRDESRLEAWLDSRPDLVVRLPATGTPQAGDVLCFRIGRCVHHIGVALGPWRFMHALNHCGAVFSTLRDSTYSKRHVSTYRPLQ